MNFEDQEQHIKEIRTKQLISIGTLFTISFLLLLYLIFGNGYLSDWIIKTFIFLSLVCAFLKLKDLKENPDKYKNTYIFKNDKVPGVVSQNERIADSIRNFSKVQFSKNTIGKAAEILSKSTIKRRDIGDAGYQPVQSFANQDTRLYGNRPEDEKYKDLRYRTRNDKSILNEISMDWPSRILPDKKQMVTRDYRPSQPQRYPSTNLNATRNQSKSRADYSNVKKTGSNVSRYESNRDLKRTVSRYSSKGKNTFHKASVNTKHFIQNEMPSDINVVDDRIKNFNVLLANLHIDIKKYDFWVHHNIQVWLAFNFIPELVRRNHVR